MNLHTHRFFWRALGTAALALALPLAAAAAQQVFTRDIVNMRAGPSRDYPLVARLSPGQPLDVIGCTRGYAWCDVVLPDGGRGWVWSRSLDYAWQPQQRVPLASYAAVIGVPVVSFVIGNYWGSYYRDRPWYGERRWWNGRPPPPPVAGWRPPPPPRPAWQPRPWPGPGVKPPPAHGVRPQPVPGFRPPADSGVRPPRPQPVHRPGPPPRPPQMHGGPGGGRHEGRGRPHGGGEGGGGRGGGHGGPHKH